MPSEQPAPVVHAPPLDVQQPQAKFCSLCHSALSDAAAAPAFHLLADALVCPPCRDGIRSTRQPRQPAISSPSAEQRSYRLALDGSASNNNVYRAHPPPHEASSPQTTRRIQDNTHFQSSQPASAQHGHQQALPTAAVSLNGLGHRQLSSGGHIAASSIESTSNVTRPFQHLQLPPLTIGTTSHSNNASSSSVARTHSSQATSSSSYYTPAPLPQVQQSRRPHHTLARPMHVSDPLVDITRLRVRSQVHQCLYPGATFEGTQKSGRNSYDVTVTVVVSIALSLHR